MGQLIGNPQQPVTGMCDQLCQRVAIIDHGKLLALDTPAALKRSVGAETEIRIHATGDLDMLAHALEGAEGIESARVVDGTLFVYTRAGGPALAEIIELADKSGHEVQDVGVTETSGLGAESALSARCHARRA